MDKNVLIIIDPGHGGSETGAVANGYKEKDLNLSISLALVKALNTYNVSNIIMTRDIDKYFDLNTRAAFVAQKAEEFLHNNSAGKVICLSIHLNACDGTARGCEAIYSLKSQPTLARCITDKICELVIPFRRIFNKESESRPGSGIDYYCMNRETGKAQTVILESLFLDNKDDVAFLKQPDFIDKLAAKIAEGLLTYLGCSTKIEVNQPPVSQHWAQNDHDEIRAYLQEKGFPIGDHSEQLNDTVSQGMMFRMLNLMRKAGNK